MSKKKKVILFISLPILLILMTKSLPYKVQYKFGLVEYYNSECGPGEEREYQSFQATVLAQNLLVGHKGNSRCLLIHHPVSESGRSNLERLQKAFQEGFGNAVSEIHLVPIRNIDMDANFNPEEARMEMTADDFNKVIKANSDCDLVISIVPLPFSEKEIYKMDLFKMIKDPENEGVWVKDPKQKYPTLGIYNGYIGNLEPLFKEGLIHSMTL